MYGFVLVITSTTIRLTRLATDTYTNEAAWSIVELMTAVICACLPTLRPLFRYFGHAVTNNTSSSGGRWRSSNNIALAADEEILNKAEAKSSTGDWKSSGYNISVPENVERPGRTTLREELEVGNVYNMCTYIPKYSAPCLRSGDLHECKSPLASEVCHFAR